MTIHTTPRRLATALSLAGLLSGCAAFPELDGKPVGPVRAATLMQPGAAEARLTFADFGDASLRRMLDEAALNGLDVASARGRARAADLVTAQTAMGRLPQLSSNASANRDGLSGNLTASFEPDITGRLDAQLTAARLESQATGIDLLIARRLLAREVVAGWVALAEAHTTAASAGNRVALADREVTVVRARLAGGEVAATALSEALTRQSAARQTAASAGGQIALAGARLRALGVKTVPNRVSLRNAKLPTVPAKSDLTRLDNRPEVCAAWLRFHAADASRAETLRSGRPRIAATGSLNAAAKTLAGLVSGNPLAVASSLSLEGSIIDSGQARNRLDQSRLGVAQAEIGWLQARSRAEIATLEAAVELIGARDALDAARTAYGVAEQERARARARKSAGVDDGPAVLASEVAVLDAQTAIDTARARAFRAAAMWNDVAGPAPTTCRPTLSQQKA